MSDDEYEYESDAMDEYQYSDGGEENEMEQEQGDTEEQDHFGEWNQNEESNHVANLGSVMRLFPSHPYSASVQKSISTSQIPDGKAIFADYWDFIPKIHAIVIDVTGLLSVNYDVAYMLLIYYKFDKERLLESYYGGECENVLVELGLYPTEGNPDRCYQAKDVDCSHYIDGVNGEFTCAICYDDFNIPASTCCVSSSTGKDSSDAKVPTVFCCSCKHVLCSDCFIDYICNKLYSEGITCLSGSNMSNSSIPGLSNGEEAKPPPSFVCPFYKCNVMLPFSAIHRLLCDNMTNITVAASSAVPVQGDSKTSGQKPPSTIVKSAHCYFLKYIEYVVKYYISCTNDKYTLPSAAYTVGSSVLKKAKGAQNSNSRDPPVDAPVASNIVPSIQFCPSPTCGKIVLVGNLPSKSTGSQAMSSSLPSSAVASPIAANNSTFAHTSNPIVPLYYTTNVRCSHCCSSFCLICQQGECTKSIVTSPDGLATEVLHQQCHMPASCSQYAMWCDKNRGGESDTAAWLLVNTKMCPGPKCNDPTGKKATTRIEKNQGCNHMTCRVCRHEFCWICMGPWSEHQGSYYKCNKYEEDNEARAAATSKEQAAKLAKMELDRYLHYYSRYQGHESAIRYAATTQRDIVKKKMLALLSQQDPKTVADVGASATGPRDDRLDTDDGSFMKAAVEQVIQCRIVLKYSYILGYFLCSDISNYDPTVSSVIPLETLKTSKELFEYQQEMLEKNTEQLSELTEKYCNNIGGPNGKKFKPTKNGDKSTTSSKTESAGGDKSDVDNENIDIKFDLRNHIINLTRITEKFTNHLLSSIGVDGNVSQLLVLNAGGEAESSGVARSESERMYMEMIKQMEQTGDISQEELMSIATSSAPKTQSSMVTRSMSDKIASSSDTSAREEKPGGVFRAVWNTLNPGESKDRESQASKKSKK